MNMSVCAKKKLHRPWRPVVLMASKHSPQTAVKTPHLNRLLHSPISGKGYQNKICTRSTGCCYNILYLLSRAQTLRVFWPEKHTAGLDSKSMLYRVHSELGLQSELAPVMQTWQLVATKQCAQTRYGLPKPTDFSEQTTYLSIGDSNITA